jgi:16S rRNA (uracil1498-N3)-methyltransferase
VTRPGGRPILANMADRFYVNCPLHLGPVVLDGAEAHHLATVLRARPGDAVCLFNGDGAEYPAIITNVHKRQVMVEVNQRHTPKRELDFRLEVAAPLPKGDRGDFLLEKLTELGVTRYVPLRTRRSVVHPAEARHAKLERAVIEASKQCGRNVLMEVGPLVDWEDYVHRPDLPAVKMAAHPGGESLGVGDRRSGYAVAVGPEGGFTDDEIAAARAAEWRVVGLGPRVLRVETAALALAVRCAS